MKKEVLQKYISRSGYCSRRMAGNLISNEEVFVNGEVAHFGQRVDNYDEVLIGDEEIKPIKNKIYIVLNKPVGIVCTSANFKNEKNVFELLPVKYDFLHIVGRLDKDSSGLVLFTNDGMLTQKITHPSFGHEKKYIVDLQNKKNRDLDNIKKRFVDGIDFGKDGIMKAKNLRQLSDRKFEVILTEGKKRQIRRMFGEFGERIIALKRISIGNLKLGNLKEGEWRFLKDNELDVC